MVLAWCGCAIALVTSASLLVQAIRKEAESREELTAALVAYAVPIPGGIVTGIVVWGRSPVLLLVPGAVYLAILLLTRWQPLLLLGYFIDRIDQKVSDRYAGRLVVLILAAVTVGGLINVFLLH